MRPSALALLALPLALVACGGSAPPRGASARVTLELSSPGDGATVRDGAVEVRGTVHPRRASVRVAGHAADVRRGEFAITVPLSAGPNVIDVAATMPGARPALAALRVVRDDRVTIPRVVGEDPDAARARLESLGLKVTSDRGGPFFDPIVPSAPAVCDVHPAPGTRVSRGSHVTLVWARDC